MKRGIRIFSAIGALVLIIILLFLTMSFTGNPISKVLATRSADKYIEENYPDLNLQRKEAVFEFKLGNYVVEYYQENSKDFHFGIEADYLGRIIYDGYEEMILGKWNTMGRLEEELNSYVERLVRDNLAYDYNMVVVNILENLDDEEISSQFELDEVFQFDNLPLTTHLNLYIYEEDRSLERISEILFQLDDLMEAEGMDIYMYSIILQEPGEAEGTIGESYGVYGVTKKALDMEDFHDTLEEYLEISDQ